MSASLALKATAGGSVTLTPPNTASNYVLTLPLGSGTLAGPNSTPVSVIDYGADPTGVVDSTTAIQNALTASKYVTFGKAGNTYIISGTLTVQTGSTLMFNNAIVTQTALQMPMFDVRNTSGVTISGGNLVGALMSTATAGAFVIGRKYTILTVGTTDFTLIGASANTIGIAFTASGVGSGTGTVSTFFNSAASLDMGIRGDSTTSNLLVCNNTLTRFAYSPLYVTTAGTNIQFIDNIVTGPGASVLSPASNGFRNCTGATILGNGVTIRGNTIQDTAQGLIVGQQSTDVVIDANIIKNTLVEHGMYCDTGIQRLTISNNLIHNTCGMGMKVQWYNDAVLTQVPSDMTIIGNVIQNTGTEPTISGDGILVYNVAPNTITPTISGITQANPAVFTTSAVHGLVVGDTITIAGVSGMISVQSSKVILSATNAAVGVFTTAVAHNFVIGSTITLSGMAGGTWSTTNNAYTIASTSFTATTFTLLLAAVPVNTTGLGAYTANSGTGVVYNAVANTVNDVFTVLTTPLTTTFTVATYQEIALDTTGFTPWSASTGSITKALYGNNITITGNSIRTIGQDGISLRYVKNAVISDNVVDTCGRNGLYGLFVSNVDFLDNNVSNIQYNGVAVYAPLRPCRVRNNTLINPGAAGIDTSGGSSGILLDSNGGVDCSYNTIIGEVTSTKMFYGIQLASGDKRQYTIDRNIIQRAESGGITLWNDTPNVYPLISLFNNISQSNPSVPGWQNSYGGLPTATPSRGSSQRDFFGDVAPVSGTWVQGDKVLIQYPVAGGPLGYICLSGGTPGTWYPFGAVQGANAYSVTGGATDRALSPAVDTLQAGLNVLGTLIADLQAAGILRV